MKIEKKQLLVFGYGLPVICIFIAYRILAKEGGLFFPAILVIFASAILYITIMDVGKLIPFYKKWMSVVHVIGMVITTVILSMFYYLVFGISGIVLRLLKKDLLDQKLEPNRASYWKKREVKEFEQEHYKRQF